MTHIQAQWTTSGFMIRFEELLTESKTYLEAYQRAEKEHHELFGHIRYKSYDAFRQVRKGLVKK